MKFLVSDLKVVDSPQAGLGVARCLRDLDHDVYGLDNTPLVTNSPMFKKVFTIEELQTLNMDGLMRKIRTIKENYDIDYIVPCFDETAILFSFLKPKLDFLGIELISLDIDVLKKIRKINLKNIKSIKTPDTKQVNSISEAQKFAKEVGFSLYVKGLIKAAIRATNDDELATAINRVSNIWNSGQIDCLIQKEIVGKAYNILIAIRDNKIVSYQEMEKVAIDGNGATWFGKMTTSNNFLNFTKKVVDEIEFGDGIIEIEGLIDEKTGEYFIIEFNPRPPAWIYATSLNGQNFFEHYLNPKDGIVFNKTESYFGRETKHFITQAKNLAGYSNLQMFNKGAAYKTKDQKYPSDLLF